MNVIKSTVTQSAERQITRVSAVASDAISSGAWAYPFLAVPYLASHPSLLRPVFPVVLKGAVLSVVVVFVMFAFAYFPQVAILAFMSGPLAFIAAVPLVLGEAYVVLMCLARTCLFGQVGIDLFDAVLVQKGHSALVEKGRQVTGSTSKTRQLGKLVMKPWSRFSTDSVVRYILTLPLNLVPVIGTTFFLGYNGYKSGPGYHGRYFQLKGFDKERQSAFVQRRRGAYTAFGTVAMLLNLIPVVSVFFTCTTAVGAALWAADLEVKSANEGKKTPTEASEVKVSLPRAEKDH